MLAGALAWWGTVATLAQRFRGHVEGRLHVIDFAGGVLLLVAAGAAVHVALTVGRRRRQCH